MKICDDLFQCINQVQFNSRLAVAISHDHARRIRKLSPFQFYCFETPEIIHSYALTFYVRATFPYINELNGFIEALSENGFSEKWRADNGVPYAFRSERQDSDDTIITLEKMIGLLCFTLTLQVLVILVFFSEILIYRSARKANSHRFWKIAEKSINPVRYFLNENKRT